MLTPRQIESLPVQLMDNVEKLEDYLIRDICGRFRESGASETALHRIRVLQRQGLDLAEIEKRIRRFSGISQTEIDRIFDRAIEYNNDFAQEAFTKSSLLPNQDAYFGLNLESEAIRRQTLNVFSNLTQSMGFNMYIGGRNQFSTIAETYQKMLDIAYTKVASGGVSYNQAIQEAVKDLTDSGLGVVMWSSGRVDRVDVAVRRAVMTGINQVSTKYSDFVAEKLETDLVETTAHQGARDTGDGYENHKRWQGKVYSRTGHDKRYPSLELVCGLGQGGGLCGWNCRHSYYAFVDGISVRTYTDEELRAIDPPPFEYEGKTYTAYEATQIQRKVERTIRQKKRNLIGYHAAGLDEAYENSAIRLNSLNRKYTEFSEIAGLTLQRNRAQIQGFGRRESARAVGANRRAG